MLKRKISIILIVSLIVSLMAGCTAKKKYISDVLDYCSTSSEIFDVLEKVEAIPSPENLGTLVLKDYHTITPSDINPDEVTKEDVKNYIDSLINDSTEYKVSNRKTVKDGDLVNIDYKGSIDGEEFNGGSAEGYDLLIGSNQFIEGFESQLINHKLGSNFDIYVTFPKEYGATDLAGKKAKFNIKINEIKESVKPKLDADFFLKYSQKNASTSEAFETEIKERLEMERLQYIDNSKKSDFEASFIDGSEFTPSKEGIEYIFIKTVLVDMDSAKNYGQSFRSMIESYGMDAKSYVENVKAGSINSLKYEAIVNELAKQFGIKEVTDEQINKWFEMIQKNYNYQGTLEELIERAGKDLITQDVKSNLVMEELYKRYQNKDKE